MTGTVDDPLLLSYETMPFFSAFALFALDANGRATPISPAAVSTVIPDSGSTGTTTFASATSASIAFLPVSAVGTCAESFAVAGVARITLSIVLGSGVSATAGVAPISPSAIVAQPTRIAALFRCFLKLKTIQPSFHSEMEPAGSATRNISERTGASHPWSHRNYRIPIVMHNTCNINCPHSWQKSARDFAPGVGRRPEDAYRSATTLGARLL